MGLRQAAAGRFRTSALEPAAGPESGIVAQITANQISRTQELQHANSRPHQPTLPPSLSGCSPPHFSFPPAGRLLTLRRICLSLSQVSAGSQGNAGGKVFCKPTSQKDGRAFFACPDLTGAASEEATSVSTTGADSKGMTTVASDYL